MPALGQARYEEVSVDAARRMSDDKGDTYREMSWLSARVADAASASAAETEGWTVGLNMAYTLTVIALLACQGRIV